MSEPLCTVVLPTNRVGYWLSQAVESVLQNSGNFECLVVLDAVEAPNEEWADDPRLRFLELRDSKGLSYALNQGILHARSPLIARMDGDDIADPRRLLAQISYLQDNPDTVVVGSAAWLMPASGDVTRQAIGILAGADLRRPLLRRNVLVHPSVMFRKEAVLSVGGYNENISTMEDYDLWLRLGTVGRVANLPAALLSYRVHGKQMSRSAPGEGAHIDSIREARLTLARLLGVSFPTVMFHHYSWVIAQQARFHGLVKTRYLRLLRRRDAA